jgi:hypothetical protein
LIEIIEFFARLFRRPSTTKQISGATKPFPAFGADIRKQRMVINSATKRRAASALETGDSQMRTLSFLLAFGFVLAGPSMAGSSDGGVPGIGTFAYNGSSIATSAPEAIIVAAR